MAVEVQLNVIHLSWYILSLDQEPGKQRKRIPELAKFGREEIPKISDSNM